MKKLCTLILLLLTVWLVSQTSKATATPEQAELRLIEHYGGVISGPVAVGGKIYFGEGPYLAKMTPGLSGARERYGSLMPGQFSAVTANHTNIYGTVWDITSPPSIIAAKISGGFSKITDSIDADTDIYDMTATDRYLFVIKTGGVAIYSGSTQVGFYADAAITGCCKAFTIEVEDERIYYTNDGSVTILKYNPATIHIITKLGAFPTQVNAIDVVGNVAHITRGLEFVTYDVSDPTDVSVLDKVTLPNGADSIVVHDDVAYVSTRNIFPSGEPVQLFSFSVLVPGNIVELDRYEDSRITGYSRFAISGNYLYFTPGGHLYSGLKAFDISTPSSLRLITNGYDNEVQRPSSVIAYEEGIGVTVWSFVDSSQNHLATMRKNLPSLPSQIATRADFTPQAIGAGYAYGAGEDKELTLIWADDPTGTLRDAATIDNGNGQCCWQVVGNTIYGVAWNGHIWTYHVFTTNNLSFLTVPTVEFNRPREIIIDGSTMYVLMSGGVAIVDISDKQNPSIVKVIPDRGSHIAVNGKDALFVFVSGKMNVYDVRNSAEPNLVHSADTGGATDVDYHDNVMYIAANELQAFNVANPCKPVLLATFPFGGRGPQSVEAELGGVYVAASEEGLFKFATVGASGTSCIGGATSGLDHHVYLPLTVR